MLKYCSRCDTYSIVKRVHIHRKSNAKTQIHYCKNSWCNYLLTIKTMGVNDERCLSEHNREQQQVETGI